jgi:hypothetical protein
LLIPARGARLLSDEEAGPKFPPSDQQLVEVAVTLASSLGGLTPSEALERANVLTSEVST